MLTISELSPREIIDLGDDGNNDMSCCDVVALLTILAMLTEVDRTCNSTSEPNCKVLMSPSAKHVPLISQTQKLGAEEWPLGAVRPVRPWPAGLNVAGLRQQSPAWPAKQAGWGIRPPALDIIFLFSDYSRSIVNLYVRSDSTNTAQANVDSVVVWKVKDQGVEFGKAQIMLYKYILSRVGFTHRPSNSPTQGH